LKDLYLVTQCNTRTDKSILRLTRFSPATPDNNLAQLALTQWTRAAAQRNIDALVKVADYYYYGLGVSDEPEQSRVEKAARYYQSASDTQMSALAMWNLGWMYENGVGVPQVFIFTDRSRTLRLKLFIVRTSTWRKDIMI
jgi:SEL1 protein